MLLAAANSIAMSLGRHRGATLIGRPLDLSVQAVLEAQDDVASLCLDADVFFGDNKVDKSRIRVTAEKASPTAQDAVIRIRSTSLVDEPVVTLYLRVGCQQKTERRYVTLADLAPDAVPDKSVANSSVPSGRTQMVSPMQVSPPQLTLPASASPTVNVSVTKPVKKTTRSADAANPGPTNRSRLKVESLAVSIERDPQLKSSAELLSAPASSPQERSAAAALWRALTAQPQDILRDAEKRQSLESTVRSLQSQSQKNQQSINELGTKLERAQSERYANPLVYALAFFLLLALSGLAYLNRDQWLRRRFAVGDVPWWRKKNESQQGPHNPWVDSEAAVEGSDFGPKADLRTATRKRKSAVPLKAGQAAPELDMDLGRLDSISPLRRSSPDSDSVPPLASKFRTDFAPSMTQPSRAVKAEELFDVQQQADFFVSIGNHEQAIEVLRSHIGEGVETSALVYLDLFNLYHQLERKADYAALREDCNRLFNTNIPVFDLYTNAGPGLEVYQMAMSRIESLWPSPKVLEIIEESIFRRPETHAEAFNLEAYRELLMLYAVAKEIISPEPKSTGRHKTFDLPDRPADSVDSPPMSFLSTSIQPLSASIDKDQPPHPDALSEPLRMSTVPPASFNLGLDLDLSQPMAYNGNAMPVDVSDAEFFAQFDKDDRAALPASSQARGAANKVDKKSGNLMDFDAFESAPKASDKLKLPKA